MATRKKQGLTGYIADGDIQHGVDGVEHDGGALVFHAGDPIPDGVFTEEELGRLVDLGAVVHRDEFGAHPLDAELEAKQRELEEIEARLREREERVAAAEKAAAGGEPVE